MAAGVSGSPEGTDTQRTWSPRAALIACTFSLLALAARADDADDRAAASQQAFESIRNDWRAWKDLRRELAGKYVANATRLVGATLEVEARNGKSVRMTVPKAGFVVCE